MYKIPLVRRSLAALLLVLAPGAAAQERQELEALRATTLNLIKLLVEEGLLTQEKANALMRQAEQPAARPGEKPKPSVRVPYVPETVRQEIKDQVREEVIAQARAERWADPGRLPEWADRITIEGDVRLRAQHDMLDQGNVVDAGGVLLPTAVVLNFAGQNITNSTEDQTRLRLRARLGVHARVTDDVQAAIRFATGSTGSTGSPGSLNNTLGGTEYSARNSAGIDLAYVRWNPSAQWFTLTGGRIPNPFFSSDLLWAQDLNFDGVAVPLRFVARENLQPFVTLGAFPLRDFDPSPAEPARKDKWLQGVQVGVDYGYATSTLLRLGAAYYDYRNIAGIPNLDPLQPNLYDWTAAPAARQKGNTVMPIDFAGAGTLFGYASQFRIVNLTGEIGFRYDDLRRVTLLADWAKNVGFDREEILGRTGADLERRDSARHLRLTFGHSQMQRWGDWFAFGGYKRVEADSVLDVFTDGDFHLGGTNAKGWYFGGGFGIGRNAWFGAKYSTGNQIDGPPLAIDVLQIDMNARF